MEIPSKALKNAVRPELVVTVLDVIETALKAIVQRRSHPQGDRPSCPHGHTRALALPARRLRARSRSRRSERGQLARYGHRVGVYTSDRMELRGTADVVLMNLGQGRLETYLLEPQRDGFSNGITLADSTATDS